LKHSFTGFKMNKKRQICEDIDECEYRSTNECMGLSQCINTPGSYECRCPTGFTGEFCSIDINECDTPKMCAGTNGYCVNTYGSFECRCPKGYAKREGENKCKDVNECELETHNCWGGGICRNTWGSFKCRCPDGFSGDGYSCEDENECKTGSHDCHELALCENTLGSFKCTCKKGTHGNGQFCDHDIVLFERGGRGKDPDLDLGVVCGLNPDRPFIAPEGCEIPTCEANLEIINAWESNVPRINKRAAGLYGEFKHTFGFSAIISIPEDDVFGKNGFTLLLRFPTAVERGSFQVYNLQVVNFFTGEEGGYDLLLRPKTDSSILRRGGEIKVNQFQIVADRLPSHNFPSVLYWNSSPEEDCFSDDRPKNLPKIKDLLFDNHGRQIDQDNIRKIVLKEDEIRRIARL